MMSLMIHGLNLKSIFNSTHPRKVEIYDEDQVCQDDLDDLDILPVRLLKLIPRDQLYGIRILLIWILILLQY